MCLSECLVAGLQRNNRTSLVPLLNRLLRDFQNFVLFTYFTGQFIRKHLQNHHRLLESRITKTNQLFHREHGLV